MIEKLEEIENGGIRARRNNTYADLYDISQFEWVLIDKINEIINIINAPEILEEIKQNERVNKIIKDFEFIPKPKVAKI